MSASAVFDGGVVVRAGGHPGRVRGWVLRRAETLRRSIFGEVSQALYRGVMVLGDGTVFSAMELVFLPVVSPFGDLPRN